VPRVSVLLPVRDAGVALDACLASLRRQTLADHEVIAVDDGSADGSGARLECAARLDPRLRVSRTPPRGLVAALNHGLGEARAPLLARMDADDVAHPERLARQAERLERDGEIQALGSRVRLTGAAGAGMRRYVDWSNALLTHEAILADLLVESPLVHPSVMMRTAALRALGGYRCQDGPEDYDLWLRGAAAGWRFAKLPELLLDWHDHPERLTRRDSRYAAERFRARKLEALEAGPLAAGRRPLVIWGAGPIGKGWARCLRARRHTVAAFVEVSPRRIGQRIAGVPVCGLPDVVLAPGALHLAAVGQPGARQRIRAAARQLGLVEGRDLVAVA